jgi:hypothetical protein
MLTFIRSADNLKTKLIAVYALNVTDILLTLALTSTGAFYEGNPMMAAVLSSTAAALAIKLIAPAALIALLIIRLRGATPPQRKSANLLICALLALYVLINISHIVWSAVYFAVQSFA